MAGSNRPASKQITAQAISNSTTVSASRDCRWERTIRKGSAADHG